MAASHLLGVLLGAGAAVSVASHHVFVRLATDRGAAADAVLFVMGVNVLLLVPAVGALYYPAYALTPVAVGWFLAAGLAGTLLGRLFLYVSIERIGASRTSPLIATNALFATLFGVVLLGESLTAVHGLGILGVVVGAAAIAWETSHDNPLDRSGWSRLHELLLPVMGAVFMGIEPTLAKFGLAQGTPAPVGLVVKTVGAAAGFALYLAWRGALPGRSLLRSADRRWLLLAGLTNTSFLACYYLGLAVAPVNVVFPIITSNTLLVMLLSAVFMPERLERVTWRLAAGAAVVVAGVVVITLSG